ncbi:hypothetical protein KDL44_03270 [bacterium]|nr:hypothetical protein [bacterium]
MKSNLEESLRKRLAVLSLDEKFVRMTLPWNIGFLLLIALTTRSLFSVIFALIIVSPELVVVQMRNQWFKNLATDFRHVIRNYITRSNVLIDIIELQPQREVHKPSMEQSILKLLLSKTDSDNRVTFISGYCRNWYQRISTSADPDVVRCIKVHRSFLSRIVLAIIVIVILLASAYPALNLPWELNGFLWAMFAWILAWDMTREYRTASNSLNNLFEAEVIKYLLDELDFGEDEYPWADYKK